MKTTLVQHGDQKALIVDESLLEQLMIDMDTPLDLSTNGETLIVKPIREEVSPEFQAMMEKINSRYSRAFKRLAE
jgi:antitoxin MazE